jgi:hypothetical protein
MPYGTVNAEQMTTQSGYTLGAGNASSFKNRIINGAMVIDQRNAAGVVPTSAGTQNFVVDRFKMLYTQTSKMTGQQSSTAPIGFNKSTVITSSSAYSVLSTDYFIYTQYIEGYNIVDFSWGTVNAKPVTLSFWVYSSLTGTFGGALGNGAGTRSFPFSYTINSANTWEQKTITVTGETTGTWDSNTGTGLAIYMSLGSGSTYSTTAGSWVNGLYISSTGATSVVGTNGATWYLAGVQLEVGTVATSFDTRSYGTELALCQRYFYKNQNTNGSASYPIMLQAYSSSAAFGKILDLPVTMRAVPTAATTATSGTFTPSTASGNNTTAFSGTIIESCTVNTLATGAWTGSSGLVAGNATVVAMPNNAFVTASAEL